MDCLHLRLIIMIVDVGAHLNFFNFLSLLRFAREVRLFLRLIFIFANVKEFGNRRISVWRDFNQIKAELCGLLHGFSREHHAQIFAVFVDYTHLGRNDIFVKPGAIDRWWRRPIGATGGKWWYRLISRQL